MIINNSQQEDLELEMRSRELQLLADHAGEFYATRLWELSETDILRKMNRMVNQARKYGLETLEDVSVYVLCAMELGEGFEEKPQHARLKQVLTDSSLPAAVRVDRLDDIVFEGK